MTRRTRLLLILLGMLLFYVGSYVVLSVNGEMAYADLTLNITFPAGTVGQTSMTFPGSQRTAVAWQPFAIRANPGDEQCFTSHSGAIQPGERNFLGWFYAPLLALDRWLWHTDEWGDG